MWITTEGQVITVPAGITRNGLQYPQTIFQLWSKGELSAIGVKPYHPAQVPHRHVVTSSTLEEVDGEIYERVETEPMPEDPTTYAVNRMMEYPTLSELNVALWEKVVEGRPEYSEALEAKRQEIKAKYPKP